MEVIHEDDHLIVVDKPSGLSVLPEGWDKEAPFLLNILKEKYGRIWVIHRLDKVTSGVLVFALTPESHRDLNRQFEKRLVEKHYHAILNGLPSWNEKTTRFPLRANVGHRHRTVVDDRKGDPAETFFKILKRFPSHTLVEAMPHTGRTHQIRAHALALGYPLLGDMLYRAPETDSITRPALHSYSITFNHPATNQKVSFQAPYPEDFSNALKCICV